MSGQFPSDWPGHAFICYVREDRDRVDRLQQILEAAGIEVWRDTTEIRPGQDWRHEIHQAILSNSLVFIACFSENSARRGKSYQNDELADAAAQMRLRPPGESWLIPVRFTECAIPEFDLGGGRTLGSLHYVDLFDEGFDDGAGRLVAAIAQVLGSDNIVGSGFRRQAMWWPQALRPTSSFAGRHEELVKLDGWAANAT